MENIKSAPDRHNPALATTFTPVKLRRRHDGWDPDTQVEFIKALAESACVDEACRRVGRSRESAYELRRRPNSESFRTAWDAALDYAVRRLSDVAFSRCINGVPRPVFYKGEQIGERRHYDERLTMFLLRYRDPCRYGAWLDHMEMQQSQDGPAVMLDRAIRNTAMDGWADEFGEPRRRRPPLDLRRRMTPEDLDQLHEDEERRREQASRAELKRHAREAEDMRPAKRPPPAPAPAGRESPAEPTAPPPAGLDDSRRYVASTLSTSAHSTDRPAGDRRTPGDPFGPADMPVEPPGNAAPEPPPPIRTP